MRYKVLADKVAQDIHSARLSAGQRMPSLRRFCTQYEVSMSTALSCYRLLEQQGFIAAQPQSGFYVLGQTPSDAPASPKFVPKVATPRSLRRAVSAGFSNDGPFAISQLNPQYAPTEALQKSLRRGVAQMGADVLQYPEQQGAGVLRQALAAHFSPMGFAFNSEDLVISGGCMDAVRVCLLACTKPGDRVAISSPCFSGLLQLLLSMQRQVLEIPCTSDGIDLERLEQLMQSGEVQAGLFSCSHMNPQGSSLSVQQKQYLAHLANQYKVPIIEDDVYAELSYQKQMPLPAKTWDTNGYVLWCGSVSKSLAAGLRLGWCLPGRYLPQVLLGYRMGNLGPSELLQVGVADFIQSGEYARHLQRTRERLLRHSSAYRRELKQLLPESSAVAQPTGGIVLWVQVKGLDAELLRQRAHEADINILAGAAFSTRRLYRDCFRINAGWDLSDRFDGQRTVHQALAQLAELVHEQR